MLFGTSFTSTFAVTEDVSACEADKAGLALVKIEPVTYEAVDENELETACRIYDAVCAVCT